MCYFIDSEIILGNLLANKRKKEYSIKELFNIKEALECKLSNVYIDMAKNSLFSAMEYYPNLFKWTGKSIVLDNSKCDKSFIDSNFNRKLPLEIKDQVKVIISA